MKVRTFLLIIFLVIVVALLFGGARFSLQMTFGLKETIAEVNKLTNDIIQNLDEPLTKQKIRQAQQILDERKASLTGKIVELRKKGNFSDKSETADKLENCRVLNRNKIATVYNKFLDKSFDEANVINGLKDKLRLNPSPKIARELKKEIEEKTNSLNANIELLNEMENFVSNFESLINTLKEEIL
ncbi:MAG TPA: hypothetical protein PKE69_14290 [Pyrinomonadaceae bacterium]|nr:hypothetical protein [Pyrinomonadaceae bacterium]